MFEKLTDFIPLLEKDGYGEWISDEDTDPGHVRKFPFADYSEAADKFTEAIYQFVDEYPDYELTKYGDILKESGLEWGYNSMCKADVSAYDGRTVMALIVGAVRADRFCDGVLLDFFEGGYILKWLERLREIDETKTT